MVSSMSATTYKESAPRMSASNELLYEASLFRIAKMAWADRTDLEAIESQFGLNESAAIASMRRHMKPSSFGLRRKRMAGRQTKQAAQCGAKVLRHRANHSRQ